MGLLNHVGGWGTADIAHGAHRWIFQARRLASHSALVADDVERQMLEQWDD